MPEPPTVADVMTSPVIAVGPDMPFQRIAALLIERALSAVPIVDGAGALLGVVSEADLMTKETHAGMGAAPALREGSHSWRTWRKATAHSAVEAMTPAPRTVPATMPLAEAARLLESTGLRRLFVVDQAGALTGVLARRDVLRVFIRPDHELADAVASVLANVLYLRPEQVRVIVRNGEVTLTGALPAAEARGDAGTAAVMDSVDTAAVAVHLAGRVPGVITVHNAIQRTAEQPGS